MYFCANLGTVLLCLKLTSWQRERTSWCKVGGQLWFGACLFHLPKKEQGKSTAAVPTAIRRHHHSRTLLPTVALFSKILWLTLWKLKEEKGGDFVSLFITLSFRAEYFLNLWIYYIVIYHSNSTSRPSTSADAKQPGTLAWLTWVSFQITSLSLHT